jgi:hypothetical protein
MIIKYLHSSEAIHLYIPTSSSFYHLIKHDVIHIIITSALYTIYTDMPYVLYYVTFY